MIRWAWLISAGAAASIAACGGGGGDGSTSALTAADPTDKYVGTWTNCLVVTANGITVSALTSFTATKIDATHGSVTTTVTGFANGSCAPPAVTAAIAVPELSGTVTIDSPGSGPSGSDKITVTPSTLPSFKELALVTGSQLQFSDPFSAKDTQGYPTALDSSFILTRQP